MFRMRREHHLDALLSDHGLACGMGCRFQILEAARGRREQMVSLDRG